MTTTFYWNRCIFRQCRQLTNISPCEKLMNFYNGVSAERHHYPGPCITNVFATRRKNFSQWHRSFQRKLRSHCLKFLRHVAITLVIQGPGVCLVDGNPYGGSLGLGSAWLRISETIPGHEDVIKWKHFPRYWPFVRGIHRVTGEFPTQRPVTRSFDVSLICTWTQKTVPEVINVWVNNRETGDLKRHRAHYDVIVMQPSDTTGTTIQGSAWRWIPETIPGSYSPCQTRRTVAV